MSLPTPSFDTIKRIIDYWRKFKGKRIRIWFTGVSDPAPRTIPLGYPGSGGIERCLAIIEKKEDFEKIKACIQS